MRDLNLTVRDVPDLKCASPSPPLNSSGDPVDLLCEFGVEMQLPTSLFPTESPRIVCSAGGNPAPEFSWAGVAGAGSFKYSPGGQVGSALVPDNIINEEKITYECLAQNTVAGLTRKKTLRAVIEIRSTNLFLIDVLDIINYILNRKIRISLNYFFFHIFTVIIENLEIT